MRNSKGSCGRFLTTAALIGLSLTICGCFSHQPTKRPMPPALDKRPAPTMNGDTYRDLADHALRLKEWGQSCEADKSAAKEALK